MNYAEIYENWDSLPDCRMYIPGESLWGKVLPDGTFGINNPPLSGGYRWQDIVKSKELPEDDPESVIIHRRWHHQFNYRYEVPEGQTDEQSLEQRRKMVEVLNPIGHPGFMFSGVGYVMFEKEDLDKEKGVEDVVQALASVGVTVLR